MDSRESLPHIPNLVLVTGAAGFLGGRVVDNLLERGIARIRCLVRPTGNWTRLRHTIEKHDAGSKVELISGNLLSRDDCSRLVHEADIIYHLAAGTGLKAFSEAYLNSVVTTRNLLDAALENDALRRFVNVSSFAVYTNRNKPMRCVLDESCPVEEDPNSRSEAYCFAKVKQDELVIEYGTKRNLPYVILRPGNIYGPGKKSIPGRVGIDSFGLYLHLGGSNPLPLTYVDNCAEAIVLAGLVPGIEGEVFNIVDDNLPSSRRYLRLYKKNVKRFRSIYVPHALSYLFCWIWEICSKRSKGQLPPVFTRREWWATWKRTKYSNKKIKTRIGWTPRISTNEGLKHFFESLRSISNSDCP